MNRIFAGLVSLTGLSWLAVKWIDRDMARHEAYRAARQAGPQW